ncbi:bcl-2 homologous antagonist/killer [Spea bombifrons]|uniref:bcl-2 homologous antagonist/killer n=1 Tax=Spea bombifrons TaxID=233779 RepID=UPI0023497AAD|nr:bcl-2 homologous antagonist/killer [Spea bombifrons]XP_053313807.1 bcl-2 homologous antagonist/killer [Spea bombifrons]
MASGGIDEPGEGAEWHVDEEQLRNETETVFVSYAYHLCQIERTENEDTVSIENEIQEAASQPNSMLDNVGRKLAIIGDEVCERYEKEFDDMLQNLNPNLDNAYHYFKKIASGIFETGINWGRIVTLLCFGYRMAVYVFRNGHSGFFRTIAQCVARYVVESRIARWIVREGGWVAALKVTNEYFKYIFIALGAALTLQFLLRHLS